MSCQQTGDSRRIKEGKNQLTTEKHTKTVQSKVSGFVAAVEIEA